jgi:hypothetical protein
MVKFVNTKALYLDENYEQLLVEIKPRLRRAQLRAAISVNRELIQFYWEVGRLIEERQKNFQWGDKLFGTLSCDLTNSFPDSKGFSKTNLKNMRTFALITHKVNLVRRCLTN